MEWKSVRHCLPYGGRNAYTTRLGQLLETLREHNSGPRQCRISDDDLTKRDADTNLGNYLVGKCHIAVGAASLCCNGSQRCIRGTRELCNQGIAPHLVDDPAVALKRLRKALK